MNTKYSIENLKQLVETNDSLRVVVLRLGLKPSGGNRCNVKKKIQQGGIDISHFTKEKHTKIKLSNVVSQCISMSEVLKALGLRPGGGSQAFIKRKINKHGIDTSHFLGQLTNSGSRHKGYKKTWQETLVKSTSGSRKTARILRKALLDSGRAHRCENPGCLVIDKWLEKHIILQIHHRDGDWLNNEPGNLQFYCPNCHSQTENYCSGNRQKQD